MVARRRPRQPRYPQPGRGAFRHDHLCGGNARRLPVSVFRHRFSICLLYTSDAADERSSVDLGGRRIIKKKKKINIWVCRINNKKTNKTHKKDDNSSVRSKSDVYLTKHESIVQIESNKNTHQDV